ncbi:MAG: hypothetical protein JNL58_22435 [Planctomyces sp.]|nr:hypothetical protein [Planctomyces sp.]
MQSRAFALLLSGAIGILATGCASTTPTFRGQNPSPTFASWGGHETPTEMPMYHDGSPSGASQQCPTCPPGHQGHCNGAGAGCNLPFHPVHRNFHTYSYPQGLMYPPENAAPALVQYPYYTLRGPTDFFME